jgi:predicted RNA-binding protein
VGFLSASQQAEIRLSIDTDETTADLYRNPAASGGKTGARVLTIEDIPIRIRPAGQDDSNMKLVPLANPVNAANVVQMGKVAVDADIRNGDELRLMDGRRFLVEGRGTFTNARLVALSEIKS